MDHRSFAEHSETYEVDGNFYKATINFVADKVFIKGGNLFLTFTTNEYENFEGNMEDFVKEKVR